MKTCDYLLLSTIVNELSYNDIVYYFGIRTNIRNIMYGGEEFYLPDPRGFIDLCDGMKQLGISYKCLTVNELFEQKDISSIMVLLPSVLLKRSDFNPNATQLLLSYSAFEIAKKHKQKIKLHDI